MNYVHTGFLSARIAKIFTYLALVAALVVFLVLDTADERQRLISFFGLLVFIVLGWLFSLHPARVSVKLLNLCQQYY